MRHLNEEYDVCMPLSEWPLRLDSTGSLGQHWQQVFVLMAVREFNGGPLWRKMF